MAIYHSRLVRFFYSRGQFLQVINWWDVGVGLMDGLIVCIVAGEGREGTGVGNSHPVDPPKKTSSPTANTNQPVK